MIETPVSGAGRKTMGPRKGSKIAEHLQNYLDEVDDGWDEDFVLRPSDTQQEPASLDLADLLDDIGEDAFAFALEADLELLEESDKESDDTGFDDEDWDAQLDVEPADRVTLSVSALLDQPADAEPAKLQLSFVDFLKNPTPHEFTPPLLRHLPQPPVSFSTLLDIAREAPPSPIPGPPLASPARVREAPAESNVASTVISKLSGFAQQVEFAPFELSREVVATVEPPLIRRSISLAQSHTEQQEYDDGLNRMEALMNIFYQYMRSHECYTCWMLNHTDPADAATTRADLECMTQLCLDLCRYWLEELKSEIVGPKFDRAVAQYLRSCHLHVRMLEVNNYLHSVSKSLGLGSGNTTSQLEALFMEIESISGFPDVLVRARNELMGIVIADILLCRSNILPLTGVSTQPSTPHDNDTPDYQGGLLSRINSLRSLDDLESEADHTPTRDRRRSSDGVQTGLKKPLTTCLALLESNKLPAHVRSKLCFAISSYVSGVWANEQDCIDEAEMDQLLVRCQAVDEKQIIESLLYESVVTLFEGESGAHAVRSSANIAHSDALVKTLPNFASVFSYCSMRALADCWVKTKPFFALYIFPVCISMLHKQNKPIERRTLQKELAILSAHHKDTERAIVHCEAVLEDARALGELSEVVFVTDLLVSQHCDQGAFEEAVRVLQETLTFLSTNDRHSNAGTRTGQKVQLQMHTDSVHARLAHVYLLSGSPEIAAIEFERLYKSLESRPEGSAVITKKVAILSWVAKAHLKANNLDESRKALLRIRQLRKRTGAGGSRQCSDNAPEAVLLRTTCLEFGLTAMFSSQYTLVPAVLQSESRSCRDALLSTSREG